jgi:mannose-6-phosphate isomerase-like protein (cupin superfamily)
MLTSRRTLLRHSILAAPVLSADLFALPHAAAEGSLSSEQWYWYPFHNLTMKATSSDTGDTTAWMLIENSPHQGVPLHKHLYEDESFFVLSGIFEITVGGKTTTGGPGTYAYGPRNVPHQWTNMGPGRGQLLNCYTPGGIDKFFLAAGIPIHSSTEQPQVDLAAYEARTKPLREKTGIIRLGPPKYPLRQRNVAATGYTQLNLDAEAAR